MTIITSSKQLIVGQRYILSDVNDHCFHKEIDITKPFVVLHNGFHLVQIRFDGATFTQHFSHSRIDSKDFIVNTIRNVVPAIYLSRQCRILLRDLHKGHVTQRTALMDHGVMALPRRIADLKEAGYPVEKVMKTNPHTGQRYASYYLAS